MSASTARAVFERYLIAVNGRDADALDDVLHPDFEDLYPQTGELTRGADNLKQIINNYPGGYEGEGLGEVFGAEDRWVATPMFSMLRIEGTGDVFTAVQKGRYPDGTDWYIVVIAQIKDGRVWRVQSFWAPTLEPPAWRSEFVEIVERP